MARRPQMTDRRTRLSGWSAWLIASDSPAGIPEITRPMNRLWTLSLLFRLSQLVTSTTGEHHCYPTSCELGCAIFLCPLSQGTRTNHQLLSMLKGRCIRRSLYRQSSRWARVRNPNSVVSFLAMARNEHAAATRRSHVSCSTRCCCGFQLDLILPTADVVYSETSWNPHGRCLPPASTLPCTAVEAEDPFFRCGPQRHTAVTKVTTTHHIRSACACTYVSCRSERGQKISSRTPRSSVRSEQCSVRNVRTPTHSQRIRTDG